MASIKVRISKEDYEKMKQIKQSNHFSTSRKTLEHIITTYDQIQDLQNKIAYYELKFKFFN